MKLRDIINGDVLNNLGGSPKNSDSMPYITGLKAGDSVVIDLKVYSKRLQETRDGKKFLLITLSDRTGSIRAVDWQSAELNDERLSIGTVVRITAKVVVYDDRLQLNLDNYNGIQVLSDNEFNSERFLATTSNNIPNMFEELLALANSLENSFLKELLNTFFQDDKKFVERFVLSPAAMKIHHAYKGGLLEHTLSTAKMCDFISSQYEELVDRDLLITGALLHDIGKIYEYSTGPSGIDRTTDGELLGHIAMGMEMITKNALKVPNFPKRLLVELKHLILSHHGEMEWGSPITPKTIEAIALHMSDNLDSKIIQFKEIENRESNGTGFGWSTFDRFLNRRILMKNRDKSL